jgi:hypothetical protein
MLGINSALKRTIFSLFPLVAVLCVLQEESTMPLARGIIGVHSIVDGANTRNQKLLAVVVNAQHELTAIKP